MSLWCCTQILAWLIAGVIYILWAVHEWACRGFVEKCQNASFFYTWTYCWVAVVQGAASAGCPLITRLEVYSFIIWVSISQCVITMLHIKYFNERIYQYKSVSVILTISCTNNQQEKPLLHVILSLSPSPSCHSLAVSIPLETETIATKNNSGSAVHHRQRMVPRTNLLLHWWWSLRWVCFLSDRWVRWILQLLWGTNKTHSIITLHKNSVSLTQLDQVQFKGGKEKSQTTDVKLESWLLQWSNVAYLHCNLDYFSFFLFLIIHSQIKTGSTDSNCHTYNPSNYTSLSVVNDKWLSGCICILQY